MRDRKEEICWSEINVSVFNFPQKSKQTDKQKLIDMRQHVPDSFDSTTGEKDIRLSTAPATEVDTEAKKTESRLFSLLPGESRLNTANWPHGVTAREPSFPAPAASVTSGEPSLLAGNRRTTCSGDIIPKLSPSAGVLLFLEGDTYIVVFGMGVIWREFGDGVSMSERYLRMCMGVLPVLGSLLVIEGLRKVPGSSGGVMLTSAPTAVPSNLGSLLANTISKKQHIKK